MRRFCIVALLCFYAVAEFAQNAGSSTPPDIVAQHLINPLTTIPAQVASASVQLVGNPGPAHYSYWIVATFPAGNSTPAGPFPGSGAPNSLSASNYFAISWTAVQGASSYDVLRSTGPAQPQGACNCAVHTGITGTSTTDQSSTLSAYTVTTLDSNMLTHSFSTEATGHEVLRRNGALICDFELGCGGSSTSVSVNGSVVPTPNLNGTTPAAGSGFTNATLQVSGSNVSIEFPIALPTTVAQVTSLIAALPASGGVIDTRASLTGAQACAANPFAGITKPVTLLLGAVTITGCNWTLTDGQYIVGSGPDVTVIAPSSGFTGSYVAMAPHGANLFFRQAAISNLTIDMNAVSGQTAIGILSGSNLPAFQNIVIKNNDGTFVHVNTNSGGQISEGITFDTWQFYAKTPKTAPGIIIQGANETVFRDGKLLGTTLEGSQIGVLLEDDGTYAGLKFQLVNSSVASYATCVKFGSTAAVQPFYRSSIVDNTFDTCTTGVNLAGRDGTYVTSGNYMAFNRWEGVTTGYLVGYAQENTFIDEASFVVGHNFTANSLRNRYDGPPVESGITITDSGTNNVIIRRKDAQGLLLTNLTSNQVTAQHLGLNVAQNLTDLAGRRNWALTTEALATGDFAALESVSNITPGSVPRFTWLSGGGVKFPPADVAPGGSAGNGIFYFDPTALRFRLNNNNTGAAEIPTLGGAAIAGNLPKFGSNGIDLVDSGITPGGALPSGTTATTNPNPADNSANVASDAFVQNAIDLSMATVPLTITGGTYSFASLGGGGKVNVTASAGAITGIVVWVPIGSGYAAGDIVTIAGGNYDSMIVVTTVNGSGQPTAGTILYGGTGYSSGTGNAIPPVLSIPFTFVLTGTLGSGASFVMSSGSYLFASNQWIFANNTTGAFATAVCVSGIGTDACAAGGRTVTIPQGTNNSRSLFISSDGVQNVDLAGIVNGADLIGTVPVTAGGTGLGTLTSHAVQVGAATSTPAQVGPDAVATHALFSGGSSADPGFRAIATTDLPTIPVTGGGTNATTAQAAAFNLGAPYIPSGCKQAAYLTNTGDANNHVLGYCDIPKGAMGATSFLHVISEGAACVSSGVPSSLTGCTTANTGTCNGRSHWNVTPNVSGSPVSIAQTLAVAATASWVDDGKVQNTAANAQSIQNRAFYSSSSVATQTIQTAAFDTSSGSSTDTYVVFEMQNSQTADICGYRWTVELWP